MNLARPGPRINQRLNIRNQLRVDPFVDYANTVKENLE